jgi:hypothetical protein
VPAASVKRIPLAEIDRYGDASGDHGIVLMCEVELWMFTPEHCAVLTVLSARE